MGRITADAGASSATKAGEMHLCTQGMETSLSFFFKVCSIKPGCNRIWAWGGGGEGGDQNVSTLQKFTAECSLVTLNGRITMTVCSKV